MALDAGDVGAWLARWWVEATLAVLVLGGAASGLRSGDVVRVVVAVALGAALADRIRLRLDNRSLAVALGEIREGGVSAARQPAGGEAGGERTEGGESAGRDAGDEEFGAAAKTDDRGTLDREDIADLLGESDPENVDAADVADLINRAESDWAVGGTGGEGTDDEER